MSSSGPQRTYGGRSHDERRAERRRRLVASGLQSFGTAGFSRTSIEGLCAHAGVTTRHFYEEFDGREALLRAVYDEITGEAAGLVAEALELAELNVEARSRAGLGSFVHYMLDDPRRAAILCVQVVGVSEEFELHRRSVLRRFARVTATEARRAAAAGEIGRSDLDLELVSTALVAATNELVIGAIRGEHSLAPDELVELLVAMFTALAAAN
ncbi:MAG: TetR/AcrR family transcriptional regulator [Candidatus Dormibacteria bacterium]